MPNRAGQDGHGEITDGQDVVGIAEQVVDARLSDHAATEDEDILSRHFES
jgi:hypothetical protein